MKYYSSHVSSAKSDSHFAYGLIKKQINDLKFLLMTDDVIFNSDYRSGNKYAPNNVKKRITGYTFCKSISRLNQITNLGHFGRNGYYIHSKVDNYCTRGYVVYFTLTQIARKNLINSVRFVQSPLDITNKIVLSRKIIKVVFPINMGFYGPFTKLDTLPCKRIARDFGE